MAGETLFSKILFSKPQKRWCKNFFFHHLVLQLYQIKLHPKILHTKFYNKISTITPQPIIYNIVFFLNCESEYNLWITNILLKKTFEPNKPNELAMELDNLIVIFIRHGVLKTKIDKIWM